MADDAASPTSITQPSIDVSAPLLMRRSQRQHAPSKRARSNADGEDDDTSTITAGERSQNGKLEKVVLKVFNQETTTTVESRALATPMTKLGELGGGMTEL
jgi:hypothetical protein